MPHGCGWPVAAHLNLDQDEGEAVGKCHIPAQASPQSAGLGGKTNMSDLLMCLGTCQASVPGCTVAAIQLLLWGRSWRRWPGEISRFCDKRLAAYLIIYLSALLAPCVELHTRNHCSCCGLL